MERAYIEDLTDNSGISTMGSALVSLMSHILIDLSKLPLAIHPAP